MLIVFSVIIIFSKCFMLVLSTFFFFRFFCFLPFFYFYKPIVFLSFLLLGLRIILFYIFFFFYLALSPCFFLLVCSLSLIVFAVLLCNKFLDLCYYGYQHTTIEQLLWQDSFPLSTSHLELYIWKKKISVLSLYVFDWFL